MALGDETIKKVDRKRAGLLALGMNIGSGLERTAKQTASWTDRTGNTRRAITGGAENKKDGAVIYLAHGSMVGTYLEEGTGVYGPAGRPYEIRPKNKKVLRFVSGGKAIFAKSVIHPGMQARPVIEPTAEAAKPKIMEQVRSYWENA